MKTTFGSNIKFYRTQCNLTQQQLADRLSVSRQTVASYESGRTEPDIATMEKLTEIFGITVDELIGKTNHKKQLPSLNKIGLYVGIVLNAIMFARNLLLHIKDEFFYVQPGVVTEEMRIILDKRFAIAEVTNFIDGYFPEIFAIGILIVILYKYIFNEKYSFSNLLVIILLIIFTLMANLELSIIMNPNSLRGNYYDIIRNIYLGNRRLIIVLISFIVTGAAYSAIKNKMSK